MNAKETQAMLAAMEKDQKKGSFWTPEDGENATRILPPNKANEEVLPYFHHKVHWIDGTPYECVAQSGIDKHGNYHEAEPCPACKKSKHFWKIGEKDSEEWDIAYDLSAKDRYVFRIIDRTKSDETITTPEFYEVGPSIYKKFFGVMKSGRYGNIVHPLEGRDFIIDKQGTGRRTNYDNSSPDPNVTPIFEDKEMMKEALTNVKGMPYNELIEYPTAAAIQEAVDSYFNVDSSSKEEEAPAPTKSKPAKAAPAVEEEIVEESPAVTEEANTDDVDDVLAEFM